MISELAGMCLWITVKRITWKKEKRHEIISRLLLTSLWLLTLNREEIWWNTKTFFSVSYEYGSIHASIVFIGAHCKKPKRSLRFRVNVRFLSSSAGLRVSSFFISGNEAAKFNVSTDITSTREKIRLNMGLTFSDRILQISMRPS